MRRRKSEAQCMVLTKEVTARRLVTVSPEDAYWSGEQQEGQGLRDLKGAIVRVLPPADATEAQVEALRVKLLKADVLKVHILPKQPGGAVVVPAETPASASSIREVVEDMVAEANTTDRAALHEVVEKALAQVGL